tara:strand:+ start:3126 stop:4817 length:1692 start_codon:yes stop_codon:yes gene_type:complete
MWTIQGKENETLGTTIRPVSDVAGDLRLRYESLQKDVLTWTVTGASATLADLTIPARGETVKAALTGEKRFEGIVTERSVVVSSDSVDVTLTVAGAFYWLEKTPISDVITDDTGEDLERASFQFPEGDLKTNIERVFARAEALGLPVRIGTISELYTVPKMTVSNGSFADVLTELVRLCPDAMTWWDYSTTGTPKFNLTRRDDAAALQLAYGSAPLVSASFADKEGFQVSHVEIQFAERNAAGEMIFKKQTSGTSTVGKNQVVVNSGESLVVDTLPPDPVESQILTSEDTYYPAPSGAHLLSTIENSWSVWRELTAIHSSSSAKPQLYPLDFFATGGPTNYSEAIAPEYYDDEGNLINSTSSPRFVARNEDNSSIPQWLIDQLGIVKGTFRGTLYVTKTFPAGTPVWDSMTDFDRALRAEAEYYYETVTNPIEVEMYFDVDFPVYLMAGEVTAATYYKPLAYQFQAPPAGFASALKDAQDWVPYEGQATITEEIGGTTDARGKVLNLADTLPEWAAMRALVQGCDISLADGVQTIRTGSAQRLGLDDIVSRLRSKPADNVVLL